MDKDPFAALSRRIAAARQQIQSGLFLTALFGGLSFFFGSRFWFIPMVFVGVIPAVEGVSRRIRLRNELQELERQRGAYELESGDDRRSEFRASGTQEVAVFRAAQNRGGMLTPALLTLEAGFSLALSEKLLEDLSRRGYASMEVTDQGKIEYHFPDFEGDDSP